MAQPPDVRPDQQLDAIMRRWLPTIRVFMAARMACVGCPIAPFHTVADAARAYGWTPSDLLAALTAAASLTGEPDQGMGVADDDAPPPAL